MNNQEVIKLIASCQLKEEDVKVAGWEGANLFIRELSGNAGSDLIEACTDGGAINQKALLAGIILATLRNHDEAGKLVFGDENDEPNPMYRDSLMSNGLARIMAVAKQSITLSGLDEAAAIDSAKNDSSEIAAVNSPSISQAA